MSSLIYLIYLKRECFLEVDINDSSMLRLKMRGFLSNYYKEFGRKTEKDFISSINCSKN